MRSFMYFSGQWCGPCKIVSPMMDTLSTTHSVEKIDVDQNTTLAEQYNVRNIPTVIVFENGAEVKRLVGVQSSVEAYLQ